LHRICTNSPQILLIVAITVARTHGILAMERQGNMELILTEGGNYERSILESSNPLFHIQNTCPEFFGRLPMKTGFQRWIGVAIMYVLFLCSISATCLANELTLRAYSDDGPIRERRGHWTVTLRFNHPVFADQLKNATTLPLPPPVQGGGFGKPSLPLTSRKGDIKPPPLEGMKGVVIQHPSPLAEEGRERGKPNRGFNAYAAEAAFGITRRWT